MSEENTPFKLLEQASLLRDEELVIEFSIDRFQHFISVRIVLLLAIVAKMTEILNGNISCYSTTNETKTDKYFNKYANAFCWESVTVSEEKQVSTVITPECASGSPEVLLDKPEAATAVLRWLPYGLLFEALLFALPSAWWHFRVGGRLIGHLNFAKLLIEEACKYLKDVPCGIPDRKPYDQKSAQLDGRAKFDSRRNIRSVRKGISSKDEEIVKQDFNKILSSCKHDDESNDNQPSSEEASNGTELYNSYANVGGPGEGKLLDRHFFSMLCFENFSTFKNYPYLRSISSATFFAHFEDAEAIIPLNQGILRQWCHADNFSGRFLVVRYYIKHALIILLTLGSLRLTAFIFECLGMEVWHTDSFRCQVAFYEDWNVLCTIHRRHQMLAFLILNAIIVITSFIISIWQLRQVSTSRGRESSCFFENIDDRGSVAMLASLRKKQDNLQKRKNKNNTGLQEKSS